MPYENEFFYFEKCQAKLVSVRLNEMKFRAITLNKVTYTCPNLQFILLIKAYNDRQHFKDI